MKRIMLDESLFKQYKPKRIVESVDWDYFDKFDAVIDTYMPRSGEGDTMASQIVTAINKLIYKWYNDGDVYDNNYALSGWMNDLSSYANWLSKYIPTAKQILRKIENITSESGYEKILKNLADTFLSEDFLKRYKDESKKGSIYDCEGEFSFSDEHAEVDLDESRKSIKEDKVLASPQKKVKAKLLADYLDLDVKDIRYKAFNGNEDYYVTIDGDSYLVCDDEEATKLAREDVINSIDELGITSFTPEFVSHIMDKEFVDVDWFEDAMREDYEAYAYDIENETYNTKYANRLVDELVEYGIIDEDDIDENGELKEEINKDNVIEMFVDSLCDGRDAVEWYRDTFGDEEFSNIVSQHSLLDFDAVADEAIEWDGRGHFLSRWDGEEIEIDDGYYAYKQDENEDFDDYDEIISESLVEKQGFVKKYKGYSIHDTGDNFTVTDEHGKTVGTEKTLSGCEGLIDEFTKKETVTEDTVKLKDGKWANVGDDGKVDSGKFRTKKAADAQRKAMYANWK